MPRERPIPAFYCCYLLRSTIRRSSVYIGSTPSPARRLKQHNGLSKGGAVRTSKSTLRPWEMSCIVTGFPSHIAALQFEWAWQNPHITQHIAPESRLQQATQKKRSGQPKRPRHSVASLLSNLHLLLRVPSFSRWPLSVRFFSEDVYEAWLKWCKGSAEPLQDWTRIIKDFEGDQVCTDLQGSASPKRKKRTSDTAQGGIHALETGYADLKPTIEKAKDITEFEREGACAICQEQLEPNSGLYTICTSPGCESVTHMTCLSKHFLEGEDTIVPVTGSCPRCKASLRWVDVVKELSLRLRGQDQVEKLLKAKRPRKGKATASQPAVESEEEGDEEEEEEEEDAMDLEIDRLKKLNKGAIASPYEDGWHATDDSDSEAGSAASSRKVMSGRGTDATPLVIEDSDMDSAEMLD